MTSPAAGAQPGGGSPSVFQPPGQQAAASMLGGLVNPLYQQAIGGQTPGAWAYPQAQGLYPQGFNQTTNYLTGSPTGDPTYQSMASGLATGSALNAFNNYLPLYGDIYNQVPGLAGAAGGALSYLPQIGANAFSPYYGQMVQATADNPQYAQALTGAAQGAAFGGQGAQNMLTQANAINQQAFDPRADLYGSLQQSALDRSNAINAMSGVAGSPYGAGVTSDALDNFDINWQNQQLGRQIQGAQATSPLYSGATNLAYGSAQLPNQVYMKQIADVLGALGAQNQAGAQGASAYGNLLGSAGQGLGQANSLAGGLTSGLTAAGGQPYSTGATIGGNALSGSSQLGQLLSGITGIGNQQYTLPQNLITDLMGYLTGGRQAALDSAQIGQMGFNQGAQGIGGLLGGANTLFGKSGIMPLFGGGSSILGAAPLAAS